MSPTDPPIERRSHERPNVLKDATIVADDASIRCSVCNQHAHGAELRVEQGVTVPDVSFFTCLQMTPNTSP